MDFSGFNNITKEKIDSWVREEFGNFYDKFSLKIYRWDSIYNKKHDIIPGVYVFFYNNVIWKVGKHQKDALKRCKEHVRDNSGEHQNKMWEMKQIANIPDCECMIYQLKEMRDKHWLLALECFLESKAQLEKVLLIRSARTG